MIVKLSLLAAILIVSKILRTICREFEILSFVGFSLEWISYTHKGENQKKKVPQDGLEARMRVVQQSS